MVDVDRRMMTTTTLTPSHLAGLRRLSARASAASAAPPSAATPRPRPSLLSFTTFSQKLITHLKNSNTQIEPGLTDPEFALIEAQFGFTFPPDLKSVLSTGLPVGPGFPNWRSTGSGWTHLRATLGLPMASISFHIARNSLWRKSWGPRPHDPETAIKIARNMIKRAPVLIPVFEHCYLPVNPSLAGNPVFFVDETRIFCCGFDLLDFFENKSVVEKWAGTGSGSPRWVEFWTDAALDIGRRNSNLSLSSPDRVFDLTRPGLPKWVGEYLNKIGLVLREGGWGESDVEEIVHVSASGFFEDEIIYWDNQTVLDALLLKADRFSDLLRRSGWGPDEVSDCLGFEFRFEKGRKPVKKLSPELVERFERLAHSVSRS